jgi:hypothetical protein
MTGLMVCATCGMPASRDHAYMHRHSLRTEVLVPRDGETQANAIRRFRDEHGWDTRPGDSYDRALCELEDSS